MYILYSSDFKADIFISLNCKMFVTLPYEVCRNQQRHLRRKRCLYFSQGLEFDAQMYIA